MGGQLFLVLIVLLAAIVTLEAAVAPVHKVLVKPRKKCVCMNGKWCEGEIINDVQCHPNYIMVCCIQPEPEPNPAYPLYPLNRFESAGKQPEPQQEKEKPEPLKPFQNKPLVLSALPLEKILKLNKETKKGEESSEPSSESNEENVSIKEKESIKVIQV